MINSVASNGTSSPEETPLNTDSVTTTTGTPNYQISTAARTLKHTLDDLNMSLRRLSSYADRIQPVLMKLNSEAWQLRRAPISCYWLEECLFFSSWIFHAIVDVLKYETIFVGLFLFRLRRQRKKLKRLNDVDYCKKKQKQKQKQKQKKNNFEFFKKIDFQSPTKTIMHTYFVVIAIIARYWEIVAATPSHGWGHVVRLECWTNCSVCQNKRVLIIKQFSPTVTIT